MTAIDQSLKGKVLRHHTFDGFSDVARFVHVNTVEKIAWLIQFPAKRKDKPNAQVTKINQPRMIREDELAGLLRSNYSVVPFVKPGCWNLSDQQMTDPTTYERTERMRRASELSRQDAGRKNLAKWKVIKNSRELQVKRIFEQYDERDLLEFEMLNAAVEEEAARIGVKPDKLRQLVLLKLRGCGHPNALMPAWAMIGSPGVERIGPKKVGRKSTRFDTKYVCSQEDRFKLQYGFSKYKVNRFTSEEEAYFLTCAEFWPGNTVEECKAEKKKLKAQRIVYRLARKSERPTIGQFRRAAKLAELSSTKANLGERIAARGRALMGTATDGIVALGQLAMIDSTSEDQTPVSAISRLMPLSSTWRSIILEVKTSYILGFYSGFERPSTLTNLLAIYHGATPKVEFCARYGITISEKDWYAKLCKRIRADNGEMKSELGITTMSLSEVSIEFVASWAAQLKGPIESNHNVVHRGTDHKNAGTTGGRQRQRGEESRDSAACRTHYENVQDLIRFVLYHNNVQRVPHLLTREMFEAGVEPTRKAIFEWYEANDYVASEPTDLDTLRTHCLPKMQATIRVDGVYIFDPRVDAGLGKFIPSLVYVGDIQKKLWKGKSIGCTVHLDPNDLSKCYVVHKGKDLQPAIFEVTRQTSDPLANELTLWEHLEMWKQIEDQADAGKEDEENNRTFRLTQTRATNASAAKAKQNEAAAAKSNGEAPKPAANSTKINDTNAEKKLEQLALMGVSLPKSDEGNKAATTTAAARSDPDQSEVSTMSAELAAALALKKMMTRAESGV